jgi:tRNA-specific 2-thiouridylase
MCGSRWLNVYVGLSGGVASSVAAALLKEQGHRVTGVFMRNWDTADEKGMETCPADVDLASAQAVASHLGIPLVERGFEPEYWASVFEPFLSAYAEGRTPNPDIACNRHVKFGAFFEWCRAQGADAVATGHYATLLDATDAAAAQFGAEALLPGDSSSDQSPGSRRPAWRLPERETSGLEAARLRSGGRPAVLCPVTLPDTREGGRRVLVHAADAFKDQSYFLCGVSRDALEHVLLPLGQVPKEKVRALARTLGLPTADRRDSTGICFIGKRPMRQFLPLTPHIAILTPFPINFALPWLFSSRTSWRLLNLGSSVLKSLNHVSYILKSPPRPPL